MAEDKTDYEKFEMIKGFYKCPKCNKQEFLVHLLLNIIGVKLICSNCGNEEPILKKIS